MRTLSAVEKEMRIACEVLKDTKKRYDEHWKQMMAEKHECKVLGNMINNAILDIATLQGEIIEIKMKEAK